MDALVSLGLQTSVGPAVLLDAARALDRGSADDDTAKARAAALLVHVDAMAVEEAQGDCFPTPCTLQQVVSRLQARTHLHRHTQGRRVACI